MNNVICSIDLSSHSLMYPKLMLGKRQCWGGVMGGADTSWSSLHSIVFNYLLLWRKRIQAKGSLRATSCSKNWLNLTPRTATSTLEMFLEGSFHFAIVAAINLFLLPCYLGSISRWPTSRPTLTTTPTRCFFASFGITSTPITLKR